MYKLHEFREATREAFNQAEHGQEVLIDRYGKVFVLKLQDEQQVKEKSRDKVKVRVHREKVSVQNVQPVQEDIEKPVPKKIIRNKSDAKEVVEKLVIPKKEDKSYCEHGQLKGECLWKGCKYARK